MDDRTPLSRTRQLVALAYQPGSSRKAQSQWSRPGPYYDLTLLGLLFIFGIAYFV